MNTASHRLTIVAGVIGSIMIANVARAESTGSKPGAKEAESPSPPPTRVVDVVDEIHGQKVSDPYRWLENATDPEVQAWTVAENKYTEQVLAPFEKTRDRIAERLEKLNSVDFASSPSVYEDRFIFSKREGLKNHPITYIREGSYKAEPKVLFDPNTFSSDGTVSLDWTFPTHDARLIAYGKSASGSEKSTLYIRNVETGDDLPDVIPFTRYCSVAWEPDQKGFYYTRYPEPGTVPTGDENYNRWVYHHRLGRDWHVDPQVYGTGRPKEEMTSVAASVDGKTLFLTRTLDWASNDLFLRSIDAKGTEFTPVAVGLDGRTLPEAIGDTLYLLTSVGAPRYRLVTADVKNPGYEHWKELIPQQKGVIESASIINKKLVLHISEDVASKLSIYSLEGKKLRDIPLPTLGTAGGISGNWDGDQMFFSFQSFAYPPTNFRYDFDSDKLEKIEQLDLGIDLDKYETVQKWYMSKDGTRVPMFIIHKKGMELNGNNPTVLYGYGGFNISITPSFNRGLPVWLDAGGVFAVANIRGGGEFGQAWHHAGRKDKKQNVFDDFIAAGEALIDWKITSKDKLAIKGGSNGGLLVGAVAMQRPDLFRAVICAVPLLDMIRYQNFEIARLWIPEYGSAEDPEQFKTLLAYSPYHHVKEGTRYPSMFIKTGDFDSRVDPMHAKKMAAKLQALAVNGPDRPILLHVEQKAGHGQGKPLSKRMAEQADEWIYLMWQLGMLDKEKPSSEN